MKKKLLLGIWLISILTFLISCNDSDDVIDLNGDKYFMFGEFYGWNAGEWIYKLTDRNLYKIERSNGVEEYLQTKLNHELFERVKDLPKHFPEKLLEEGQVIGSPNCADQGGYIVAVFQSGVKKEWIIDTDRNAVPEYLHSFLNEIDEKLNIVRK